MIRIVFYDGESVRTDFTPDSLAGLLQDPKGVLWVDFVETPVAEARSLLEGVFGFHPLAVDDALEETHIPKVDDWQTYLYLALYGIHVDLNHEDLLELPELDCFLMPRCLVTYQAQAARTVERVWQVVQKDPRASSRGAPYLLYQLLDELMVDYMLGLEQLDGQVEKLEDTVFQNASEKLLGEVFVYKRVLLQLRRSLMPQREVLNKLSRGDFAIITRADSMYFRDIYDHLVRLYEIADTARDTVNDILEMYLSVVNNHMNDVMKTLTVITTLFMPLSFVASFWGMNYFQPSIALPGWTGALSLGVTLGGMVVVPVMMYWWMSRRNLI
ncbi:MAG: magnesium/cobalt transporter CorA [Anaerolineae bacterium]|jgi:magnesium transporter|nr:magnesium/cobalt transporter CorA [Anaerolineae bacterium]